MWQGHKPGIYENWADAQKQLKGFIGAKHKSFDTLQEAEAALNLGVQKYYKQNSVVKETFAKRQERWRGVIMNSISVDAACAGVPGPMEYKGVETSTGKEIFKIGPLEESTNNIGEFLALVHALAWMQKTNDTRPIYSDSKTAMTWVKNKKTKTTLKKSGQNEKSFELIVRAENWLRNNTYPNKILKWDTKNWGEIPADFGRK